MTKKIETKTIISVLIAIVLLAFIVLYVLAEKTAVLPTAFTDFVTADTIYSKVVKGVEIIAFAILLIIVSNVAVEIGDKNENQTVKTMTLLLGNIMKYVSVIGALLAFLSLCGVDTSTLVTASGVLALIVGLGCQTLVSDIVAGIFMIFEGDIKVGDVVVINGWRGTVLQIGLRRTKLIDTVGDINIINNSSVSNIINNTKQLSYAICLVGIEYSESIERVEAILADHLNEFKEKIPKIVEGPFYKGVQTLGDSSVVIKLLAKCQEDDKFQLERDMNREIKLLFDKHNINIPFNQVVLNYRDENETFQEATRKEIKIAQQFIKEQKELSGNADEQEC